jgi:hypothetical protein
MGIHRIAKVKAKDVYIAAITAEEVLQGELSAINSVRTGKPPLNNAGVPLTLVQAIPT